MTSANPTIGLPQVIGFTGRARSGKDFSAHILRDLYGYRRLAFGDMLKKCMRDLNPIVTLDGERYAEVVDRLGDHESKNIPEVRRLLQAFGTEVVRNNLGDNMWVEVVEQQIRRAWAADENALFTITDVRFPNEVKAVHDLGGIVIRLTRPQAGLTGDHAKHASEQHLTNVDHEVLNDTDSPDDLREKLLAALNLPSASAARAS